MGRDVHGAVYGEARVTDYLEERFRSWGLPVVRRVAGADQPPRHNLVTWCEGRHGIDAGPLLVFEAHQDTVPVEGMTIPPFTPDSRDGRIYGRGACDVKGPLAAMMAALHRLLREDRRPDATLVLACSVNEEFGCTGARELAALWGSDSAAVFQRDPDGVVVAEPTRLNLVTAHKGVTRWRCSTSGVACHSSTPEQGRNAIYAMARVVSALEDYARDTVPGLASHPRLGTPTLSVGLIAGGISVNVVPDACTIEIDRRLLPGEDPEAAYRHAVQAATERAGVTAAHEAPYIATPALPDDSNEALAARIEAAASGQAHRPLREAAAYCSDASHFASRWPTVVFGPGDIAQAHTKDEWITVEQLERGAEIYFRLARTFGA